MLKRMIMISALAICGTVGLQALDQAIPENPVKKNLEKQKKDLSPGVLICNGKESQCFKEGEREELASSSSLFSVFCEDKEDEIRLLACKDCR